jgi:hypothetical protein
LKAEGLLDEPLPIWCGYFGLGGKVRL